jgi:hypothetical protein
MLGANLIRRTGRRLAGIKRVIHADVGPFLHMKSARKKPTAAKLRSWRIIIMRSKGEYLGSVEAPDRENAEAVAIKQFA